MKNSILPVAVAACALLTGCGSRMAKDADRSDNLTLLVGSYSEAGDSALRAYSFDPGSGDMEYLYAMPVANASYFTQSDAGMLYVVTESDSVQSALTALRPDSVTGAYEVLNSVPVGSAAPCYVAVSPDGRFAITANYDGGTVAVFPIQPDGSLQPANEIIRFDGAGPDSIRQEHSHPHCVVFTPDGRYMLVDDLGTDRIHQFAVNAGGDTLVALRPDKDVVIAPGSGPRHIVFNRGGDMAYLINEISDSVTVLKYADGVLEPVQYIAADTVGARGAADIHLSADGRYMYASLRLKNDGVASFSVDPQTGLLTYIGHTATLGHPRNFTLTPDGRYMLVASRDGNAVQLFSVDVESGGLTDTGRKLGLSKPVCVKFVR